MSWPGLRRLHTPEELLRRLRAWAEKRTRKDQARITLAKGLLEHLLSDLASKVVATRALLDLLIEDETFLLRWSKKIFPGYSEANFRHVTLITECVPYFESLLEDCKELKSKGVRRWKEELKLLGHDLQAIEKITQHKKSGLIGMICGWLEDKGFGDARTLANAYSKVARSMKRQSPGTVRHLFKSEILELAALGLPPITLPGLRLCGFCSKSAIGVFRDRADHSIRHCGVHKASRLPTEQADGWRDCVGRQWWASDNGEILSG